MSLNIKVQSSNEPITITITIDKEELILSTTNGYLYERTRWNEADGRLNTAKFSRVHKSYIVALEKIKHIERNRIRIGEELIPISDSYKEEFFELLKK